MCSFQWDCSVIESTLLGVQSIYSPLCYIPLEGFYSNFTSRTFQAWNTSDESFVAIGQLLRACYLENKIPSRQYLSFHWGSASQTGFRKGCQGFRRTKMRIARRVLLAVLNVNVRIKIRVATFKLIITSLTVRRQSLFQYRSFSIL